MSEKENIDPTAEDIETNFLKGNFQKDMEAINRSVENTNELVFQGKATVEIKRNDLGKKFAVITHEGTVIGTTSDESEVKTFEEFLKNPIEFIKKKKLAEMEEDMIDEIAADYDSDQDLDDLDDDGSELEPE